MSLTPSLRRGDHRMVIEATTYSLSWRHGTAGFLKSPYLRLTDAHGDRWMRLSALSSVHSAACRDETVDIEEPVVEVEPDAVVVSVVAASSAWSSRTLRVRCTADTLELTVEVTGRGAVTDVTLLGGDGTLHTGAAGTFRSGIRARSVYVPTPTEPVAFVRPAFAPAQLGVVGDATPGRLNGIFSPPPLAFAFGRGAPVDPFTAAAGDWLALWLRAPVGELGFTTLRYEPSDGGALLRLSYEGHTDVDGTWCSPTIVIRPVSSRSDLLPAYRADLVHAGLAVDDPIPAPAWWLEPMFCGWGEQVARNRRNAPQLCRQEIYDDFLARLRSSTLDPGTIVVDDRWQAQYGSAEPDTEAWPDLKGWIAERHREGRRVLLWWKAWDPEGLPAEECVTDSKGRAVAADPGSAAYRHRLEAIVERLLGVHGLGADGFKVDFTQRAPSGHTLRPAPDSDGVWGIAALHRLVECIHTAARRVKSDSLLISHTVHPSFGDVTDMIRTNDVLKRDVAHARVSVAAQLRARHEIVAATLPHHLVDTDQWPMPSRGEWLAYARIQGELGVPALYYVDSVRNGHSILPEDLSLIGDTWAQYRGGLR